jgi:hypothetical protein
VLGCGVGDTYNGPLRISLKSVWHAHLSASGPVRLGEILLSQVVFSLMDQGFHMHLGAGV